MEFKNNVPFIKKGLEVSRIGFSGGRITASIANHGGLTNLDYYGQQRFCDVSFYQSGDPIAVWQQLFRLCVAVDDDQYYLEFNNSKIYPSGYESSCKLAGVTMAHGMWLLNDALVYSLKVLSNPDRKKVSALVLHMDCCTRVNKPSRTWRDFELDSSRKFAITSVKDVYSEAEIKEALKNSHASLSQHKTFANCEPRISDTFIGLAANQQMNLIRTPEQFRKYKIEVKMLAEPVFLSIVFGHEGTQSLKKRIAELQTILANEPDFAAEYDRICRSQPEIIQEDKSVQSAMMNVRPVVESLKVKDIPGGMRAANTGYWIWGWDSMVHSDALGFAGDADFIVAMLNYYRETSDSKLGILHAATLDNKPFHAMAFPAQCLYMIMLYNAYIFTGNKDLLTEYYPFCKWILAKTFESEQGNTGMINGVGMFPDHPEDLEQNGDDISVFNNSIYYQALKVMAELSLELNLQEDTAEFTCRAECFLNGWKHLYDVQKGYFFDSLMASDLSPRKHYPQYAILWLTPFANDLVNPWTAQIAEFMKKNFTCLHGLRMLPKWDTRFMYDGNQIGMYMPVVENFHREMMKLINDHEGIEQISRNIKWFWEQLNIPESLSCELENHGITVDNPGREQGFCAKAWLSMFYHVICGINVNLEGIVFSPSDPDTDISIRKLEIRGKKLDINISGRGWKIKGLTLNGKAIESPFRIPFSELKKHNIIKLLRSKK